MKRIDSRTVEFTTKGELVAHDRFNELLTDGLGIADAAATALEEGIKLHWKFSPDFVGYLSEDTVWIASNGQWVWPTLKGAEVNGLTPSGRAGMIHTIRKGRTFRDALTHVKGGPRMVTS